MSRSFKKIFASALFVVLLMVPTVMGAFPLKIYTPIATVSLAPQEAEARNRNTANNRLRNLRVPTARADFTQRFAATRHAYTINVRDNINRVQIQPTRGNNGQSIRHRIETRDPFSGTWFNNNWSRWRSGNAANNRITVNISQQQERRLRIAVRDRAGNVRNYTVHMRRASTNTTAELWLVSAGFLNRSFSRTHNNYTVTLLDDEPSTNIQMMRVQLNAHMRMRVDNGNWTAWGRRDLNQTVNVGQGRERRLQFQIRGAFSHLAQSPTRTRTYTFTIRRLAPPTFYAEAVQGARNMQARDQIWSRQEVINTLRAAGFSNSEAIHGADNAGINWNDNAFRSAQRSIGNYPSRQALINFLVRVGFTNAQATQAADRTNTDWYQQALDVGWQRMFDFPTTNHAQLVNYLLGRGFTASQANAAADTLVVSGLAAEILEGAIEPPLAFELTEDDLRVLRKD